MMMNLLKTLNSCCSKEHRGVAQRRIPNGKFMYEISSRKHNDEQIVKTCVAYSVTPKHI